MATKDALLNRTLFEDVVSASVRAPSMYNAQPWRFRMIGDAIEARVDPAQALPIADPNGWAARIALGAAVANARLALAVIGYTSTVQIRVTDAEQRAVLQMTGERAPTPAERRLFEATARRRSHRTPFLSTPVPADARTRMADAAQHAACWLELLDERGKVSRVSEIVRSADNELRRNDEYTVELRKWTGRDAGDPIGIAPASAGLAPEGQDLLAMRDYGGRQRAAGRDFEAEPLLAVLGTVGDSPYDDVAAGMALQAVLLTATSDGLSTSMLSQPMEVPAARRRLRDELTHFGTPHMLIRVGYGEPGSPSPRRPVADMIDE
jgi:hypothetical protein